MSWDRNDYKSKKLICVFEDAIVSCSLTASGFASAGLAPPFVVQILHMKAVALRQLFQRILCLFFLLV